MSLVQPKKLLLTYEVYKQHNGFVAPQINDEDIANGLNTPEDKFQKWSMYSQIMLNAVLMDELSMVDYTLTNIDKKAQIAIIDIMVTRLTRAFHNDELIPRNSQVSYSQQGGIQYSSTGTIDSKDALYSFFDDRERLLIQTSGLLETVFAAPQADETNQLLDNQFLDGPKVNEVKWEDKQDTIIAFNGTNMSVLQALEFLKAGKVDVDTLTTAIQTATGLTRDQAAGIILVADNNFIKYSAFRENKAETEMAQVKDVQLSEARSRADIVINQKAITQTNKEVVDVKARVTKTEVATLDYYENKDKFARVEDLIGIEVVIDLGNLAVTQATTDNAAEGILTGDLVANTSAINQTTLQDNTKVEVKFIDPAGNITDVVVIDTYKDGSFTDDEIDGDGIKVRVSGTRIILRKGDSTTPQEWSAIVTKMLQMKANRIYQIKGTVGGTIDAQARQAAATAQQKANDAYAATQTNQQAINDVNVTKTVNEAGTTEEFQDLDGATNAKQLIAQKGYVDKLFKEATALGIGQEFTVEPGTALATKALAKVGSWFKKRYTQGQASVYGETAGHTPGEVLSHNHTYSYTNNLYVRSHSDVTVNRDTTITASMTSSQPNSSTIFTGGESGRNAGLSFGGSQTNTQTTSTGGVGNKAEGQYSIILTATVRVTNSMWEELNS